MSYINREDFLEQRRKVYCENCDRRKGMRNGKLKTLYEIGDAPCRACAINDVLNDVEDFPAADVRPVVLCGDCKYCRKVDEFEYWCEGFGFPARLVRKDDFCSHGNKDE